MNGPMVRQQKVVSSAALVEETGFTLVEVVVSVVILGMAFTALIGIQTNYVQAYIREENMTRAAMFSQYIMSMIEIEPEAPEAGGKSGQLENYLQDLKYFDKDFKSEAIPGLDAWEYKLDIQSLDLAEVNDVMRRIELELSWGESLADTYNVIYYAKSPTKRNRGGPAG